MGEAVRRMRVTPRLVLVLMVQLLCGTLLLYGFLPSGGQRDNGCDCNKDKESVASRDATTTSSSISSTSTTPSSLKHPAPHLRPLHPGDEPAWGPHRLAIIVPFRDRFEELLEFVPHLHEFLNAQKVRHKFFIMNQIDNMRFNRASLINVGFLQAEEECDYFSMHDVDLLPLNPALSYAYPAHGPAHLAAPDLHPKYHYATFVGGILLLANTQMRQINGLSNKYWGWGKEDDEFYVRMKEANFTISRPTNITTGYDTFKHIHEKRRRPRDNKRYYDQKKKSRIRDRVTGLLSTKYTLESARDLTIEGAPATIFNVRLHCDLNLTPWCITPTQLEEISAYLQAKRTEEVEPPALPDGQTKKPIPLPSVDLEDIVLLKEWNVH